MPMTERIGAYRADAADDLDDQSKRFFITTVPRRRSTFCSLDQAVLFRERKVKLHAVEHRFVGSISYILRQIAFIRSRLRPIWSA